MTLADWRPFQLQLEGEPLQVRDCLRLLPGKRLAARARFHGKDVFAKVFFRDGHEQMAAREKENIERLAGAGVRVPSPKGIFHEAGWSVVLIEWLDGGQALESRLSSPDSSLLADFLDQLERIFDAGCYQADLHLDNFMVVDDRVRVVDSGDIRRLPGARRAMRRRKLENLALLCAQAGLALAPGLEKAVAVHFRLSTAEADRLASLARKARNHRIRKANRKWLRSCSAIRRAEKEGAVWLLERANEEVASSLLSRPGDMTEIKRGSRISVMGNANWIIKHYLDRSLKARIKRRLGLDSARRSWVMGWTLDMVGVPTPRPAGWVNYPDGSALLLFPRVGGTRLSEVMENKPGLAAQASEKVRVWLSRMADAGFWHGDMKAQNVLLPDGEPCFIDLDAAGWSPRVARARRKCRRDRRRLEKNRDQFFPGNDSGGQEK